jgi:hypothetical protein
MADIYAYAKQDNKAENSVLVLRDPSGFIDCGCRFKYVPEVIPCNYEALTNAILNAIDKEAAEHGNKFVTTQRMEVVEEKTYNYEELMAEFQNLVNNLMEKNQSNAPKITSIVEKYLGKGKKVGDTAPEQAEFIYLINTEIMEDLM